MNLEKEIQKSQEKGLTDVVDITYDIIKRKEETEGLNGPDFYYIPIGIHQIIKESHEGKNNL